MPSKYVDITSIIQVIGNVYNNPKIIDMNDKYNITDEDFPDIFHRTVFGAIYKLYELGVEKITLESINDFLSSRPKSDAIYKQNKGDEWILRASEVSTPSAFDYYYNRMKKMTLLRAYDNFGINVSDIYDPDNILDTKKKQLQEEALDSYSLNDIAEKINGKIENITSTYIDNTFGEVNRPSDNLDELLERLKERPEVGVPLYGSIINTVTAGARLRKLYLRSAPSGQGKTRSMIADVCYIGANQIYDVNLGWIHTGAAQPTLYITTEQELEEVQTMMLAFISNVNEDHILFNKYEGDEEERIQKAKQVLIDSKIYIIELPDFSLKDVENLIKKNIRENNVRYVFFDYIMTSLKILEEISSRAGGVKLREDHILFMLSRRLKDIANEYGIFILSGTQLNGDWKESDTPDQNLLRGAKSIADSIDVGMHILPVNQNDLDKLQKILSTNVFDVPKNKISIYKNRRGKYKGIYLWCKSNLGCCRIDPIFATDYSYEMINIDDLKITVEPEPAF